MTATLIYTLLLAMVFVGKKLIYSAEKHSARI